MMQWIQYQLDNYGTIDEVIENAEKTALDGLDWHSIVADKSGKSALIEYPDGKAVIHSGDHMPVPLLANEPFPWAGIK